MWLLNPYRFVYTPTDADAAAYIARVEGASGDNQTLESGVRQAINEFVIGCKADGIWNAIKASCIMAGARTLAGALQPLVGTAPTNFNFAAGDYNRKTGIIGGSTNNAKYLDANRNQNADPESNRHYAVYASELPIGTVQISPLIAAFSSPTDRALSQIVAQRTSAGSGPVDTFFLRVSQTATFSLSTTPATGLIGVAKTSATSMSLRNNNTSTALTTANSAAPASEPTLIFTRNLAGSYSSSRLAFYSIGESLNLALLDARVTALINAFAAAIP